MTSSSPIQSCLPLNRSFSCDSSIQINEVEREQRRKLNCCRGSALLRKHVHKSLVFPSQRTYKRRFTFSGNQDHRVIFKKRRRFNSIALPTKFLLGGNINDPLNLRSLEDEKVNQQLNAFTPASSPMPMSRQRTQVQLLIPTNIYDPLNLNTGEDIEFNFLTSKPRKRRRHRKSRRDDIGSYALLPISAKQERMNIEIERVKEDAIVSDSSKAELKLDVTPCYSEERGQPNKIVSPVVPQGSNVKFKKYQSKSFSKDLTEKSSKHSHKKHPENKPLQKNKKSLVNTEKFCYGNHFVKCTNIEDDQRVQILNKMVFCDKNVLDIGCNTGELTLYIAKHYQARKVIGVDIDKKLIDVANKKVRMVNSKNISENLFPKCMGSIYGQLAKVDFINKILPNVFPNNITFLVANYVPACQEFLRTQKPEYDVILCLRVTKWIHLNFGDDGLKLAFKRIFAQLRYGGCLILEPQPWFTYSTSKRITPSMCNTYKSLELRPESFCQFLLSEEIGFSSCELIGRTHNCTKVYWQPIYLLKKGFQTS